MPATIVARSETTFTVQIEIPYCASMLDCEETLQQRLNDAGTLATAEQDFPINLAAANAAPTMAPIANQAITAGTLLTLPVQASDITLAGKILILWNQGPLSG